MPIPHPSLASNDPAAAYTDYFEPDDPIHVKLLAVTYQRKFNLGNYQSLDAEMSVWARIRLAEELGVDLHACKKRLRAMARDNVRAQWLRATGSDELVFLGLRPPDGDGFFDPLALKTVSVGLVYKVNLGDYNSVTPAYQDWADLRDVRSSGESHLCLHRLWESLWANVEDEIRRARGQGSDPAAYFGLPPVEVEDLTPTAGADGLEGRHNGRVPVP